MNSFYWYDPYCEKYQSDFLYYVFFPYWPIGLWVEYSPVAQETGVQSQVESYQRLKKLDTSLLNTLHYKVHIKGKVEQSRERSSIPPKPQCSSYWKGNLWVVLNYSCYIAIMISITIIQADSVISDMNAFISFYLQSFMTRGETQIIKAYANHTMLTHPYLNYIMQSPTYVHNHPHIMVTAFEFRKSLECSMHGTAEQYYNIFKVWKYDNYNTG